MADDVTDQAARAAEQIKRHAHRAVLTASPWIARLARLGYAAKGLVYVLVGFLAVLAAVGLGRAHSSRGALRTLLDQPGGVLVLALIALGLAGYALWYFVLALWDPEGYGTDLKGWAKRLTAAGKGVFHVALCLAVVAMVRGTARRVGGGEEDGGTRHWTAKLLALPLGRWLVVAGGLGVIGFGVAQCSKAWRADLDDRLSLGRLGPTARRWAVGVSRFGVAARGVVFALVGLFFAASGWYADPHEARSIGGALRYLNNAPYGPWLLGAVALGLIAYGAYEFLLARYRHIEPAAGAGAPRSTSGPPGAATRTRRWRIPSA